jgi:hypothetical protein
MKDLDRPSKPRSRMKPRAIGEVLSDAVLASAAKSLDLRQCDLELRKAIRAACVRYLIGSTSTPRQTRRYTLSRLAAIEGTARSLRQLLEESLLCDDPDSPGSDLAFMLAISSHERYDAAMITRVAVELGNLSLTAACARRMCGVDKGGKEPDIELHVMLARLKALFESITDKPAKVTRDPYSDRYDGIRYKGRFFAFVEPILAALDNARGKRVRSNVALGGLLAKVTAPISVRGSASAKPL